ncbi:hypothetical protein A6V39_02840 [Candidatus Mycoplasma haematobovis]|uniref:Uncharacterized protein n=1 Tax=Candidatus Mycoplasma haematobovis TaxID=432608 RepID=A0A1A9QF65_9MOLU|nr:hypothetical protein [Candidatus Mycoplasma haematobovis]OAL10349.1 hypothetical protein A6V39_02840 [Candidatus Mycoplasma haematobovis]
MFQEDRSENELLLKVRKDIARKLNINLKEPQQQERINALFKLYKKYSDQISVCGSIYYEIMECCEKLIGIYLEKQKKIDLIMDEKIDTPLKKIKLSNVNFQFKEIIKDLESKISFNRQLLNAYESKYINNVNIRADHRIRLKELEDICWDNWLKALSVNRELRNTIIGFENRKALLALSKAYIDYYIFVELHMKECFEVVKSLKKQGIVEYYEILRRYELPEDKKVDFKLFLQKKIESKLADAVELKTLFGSYLSANYKNLESAVSDVRSQFNKDQKEIISIINHYKKFLLQKQVIFTNEAEKLVLYLKKRYSEKIDLLCSRFHMHNSEAQLANKSFAIEDLELLKKVFSEEFDIQLNGLKVEYTQQLAPMLDNFWHVEEMISKNYALDRSLLEEKLSEVKQLKNVNLDILIKKFNEEKQQIQDVFDRKMDLVANVSALNNKQFQIILERLKKDCEIVCGEILNLNNRYWVRANAEFNCEARKILIRLRHKYAPWVKSWKKASNPWMHEYLILNMNHETLKAVGEALEGYSPESELYKKASQALLQYSEISRKIYKDRDDMEVKQLLLLNQIPSPDLNELLVESNKKLEELRRHYESYWNNYNHFYNSLNK